MRLIAHSCNTILELEAAKAAGATMVECDVWRTTVGNVFVGHNKRILPDGQEIPVEAMEAMTLEQIREHGLCTLVEWLKWCRTNNMAGLIELKGANPLTMDLLVGAISILDQESELLENMSFQSFSIEAIEALRDQLTDYDRVLLWPSAPHRALEMDISATSLDYLHYDRDALDGTENVDVWMHQGLLMAQQLGCHGLAPFRMCLSDVFMTLWGRHFEDLVVVPWTVTKIDQARDLAKKTNVLIHELGAEDAAQIMSDYPE